MRPFWIIIAVILLDTISVQVYESGHWSVMNKVISLPYELSIIPIHGNSELDVSGDKGTVAAVWLLVLALFAVTPSLLKLLIKKQHQTLLSSTGLQLVTGGILVQVLNLLFHGQIIYLIILHSNRTLSLPISVGYLAIISGLLLLFFRYIVERFIPDRSLYPLYSGDQQRVDLSSFTRGIDNVHIDVLLSPQFTEALMRIIEDLAPKLGRKKVMRKRLVPQYQYERLRTVYTEMVKRAILQAKVTEQQDWLQLLYISIIKMIHGKVDEGLSTFNRMQYELDFHSRQSSPVEIQGTFDQDSREHNAVYFQINNIIFGMLDRIEKESIAKFRKSQLGKADFPLADVMSVPLLWSVSPVDEYVTLNHYLLLAQLDSAPTSFLQIDNLLSEFLNKNLASIKGSSGVEAGRNFDGTASILSTRGEYIRTLEQPSVLMSPVNIQIMIDPQWISKNMGHVKIDGNHEEFIRLKKQLRFQRRELSRLYQTLVKNDLLIPVITIYELADRAKESSFDFNFHLLVKILTQDIPVLQIKKYLKSVCKSSPDLPTIDVLYHLYKNIRKKSRSDLSQLLVRFLSDFSRYRRDLLDVYYMQQAANNVSVLENEKEIQTSRVNYTLHEFLLPSEQVGYVPTISRHAILKADLRGSSRITEELLERKLNPATHFSSHFFSPVNLIIERYGAEKLFLEGDAIILILNESDSSSDEQFCVSRACGLASDLLRVIEKQNNYLKGIELPPLELGIGIAYSSSPPRYLFDNKKKITISSAINRADRLSSCDWELQGWLSGHIHKMLHAAIYAPESTGNNHDKDGRELVYNRNGILLEPDASKKLFSELKFKRIRNVIADFNECSLYTAFLPDSRGSDSMLVVRKAPVRVYDPTSKFGPTPVVEGEHYFEVVHDDRVLHLLKSAQDNRGQATEDNLL